MSVTCRDMQGRAKTHPRPSWLVSRLSWLVPSSWALATSRSCDRGVSKQASNQETYRFNSECKRSFRPHWRVAHACRFIVASFCGPLCLSLALCDWLLQADRLFGVMVKASASRAEDPGFESRLRRDFSGVESYQWLKNWHSSGYPARRLAL